MKASLLSNLSLIYLLALLVWGCSPEQNREKEMPGEEDSARLGEAHLDVTGSAEAVPYFEKGLLLLHSFEYADAREAFLKAREADPAMAMAYWGEAMTYNHPLWRQQDYAAANEALDRLAPTPELRLEKTGTELERDLMQAAHILYGEGDKFERDKAYSDHLGALYEKYRGNHEVAALYALSLLGSVPVGRDEEVFGKGAVIAKGILAENPRHPGALHYLIHSYDDPGHAHLAKNAADNYSEVAPDAAHALHMPSHIYVALGMWDEVVASNIDSYEASVKRMERKELGNDGRSYHAFHWLMYGYLQQERFDQAKAIMMDMQRYTEETPSRGARDYLINMKGNYLVETGEWNGDIAEITVDDRDDLNISARAVYHFTNGRIAYEKGAIDSLNAVLKQLESEIGQASNLVSDAGVPMCSSAGSNRSAPNQQDLDIATVMKLQLQALAAMMAGDDAGTETLLREAVQLQESSSYDYGPPTIVWPAYEMYGDWLLEQNRPEEALEQYRQALYRGPKRVKALRGMMEAGRQAGDEAAMDEAKSELEQIQLRTRAQAEEAGGTLSLR